MQDDEIKTRLPTVRKMLILRAEANGKINEDYVFFCEKFLQHVVGVNKFKAGYKNKTAISSLATASDEAFALLLLENTEIRWLDEHSKNPDGEKKIDETTLPRTKYTSAGQNKQQRGFTKRYGGWKLEGINRYNELFDMVVEDRTKHGIWFDAIVAKRFAHSLAEGNDDGVAHQQNVVTIVRARNHLFQKPVAPAPVPNADNGNGLKSITDTAIV